MHTAGTDPGYIPGLTSPRPADAEEEAPEETAEHPPEDVDADDDVETEEAEAEDEDQDGQGKEGEAPDASDAPEDAEDAEDPDDPEDPEEEDGGVAFDASDRRGVITAGRRGITFRLDGEQADFGWHEIGAVEIGTPRFGKRFSVTVYTTDRRWYEADVEAPAKSVLKEWTAQLDAVLDAYFEENAAENTQDDAS
ncbi:hypothetical protein [Streptomyces sp. NPDC005322]|uniref:hypothetical protein n=1 Tax=Streptomyces sp. NPDC005322 TaxID=3157032 RepID=UPI00339DF4AC